MALASLEGHRLRGHDGVFAAYTYTGFYAGDWHTGLTDWLAVPAAAYFLWVVQALYNGTYRDWNQAGRVLPASAT